MAPPPARFTTFLVETLADPHSLIEAVPERVGLVVPDLGNFNDVAVVDVLVKAGDNIEVDPRWSHWKRQGVHGRPRHRRGRIAKVLVKRGDKVPKGSVIARVENNSQAGAPAAEAATAAPAVAAAAPPLPRSAAPAPSPPAREAGVGGRHGAIHAT